MNSIETIRKEITEFRDCNKFEKYQSLQPAIENSTPDTVALINRIFNGISEKILTSLTGTEFKENEIRAILMEAVDTIEAQELDTEDFEFGYELVFVLSKMVDIDIEKDINQKQMDNMEEFRKMLEKQGLNPKDFGIE
jgi:hypothetical protein